MSTVPSAPPPPPSVQLQSGAVQGGPTATVQDPPPDVQRLPQGTQLDARVIEARAAVETLEKGQQRTQDIARDTQAAQDRTQAQNRTQAEAEARARPTPQGQTSPTQAPQTQAPQAQAHVIRVATPQGELTLRSPVPLPAGGNVALEVVNTSQNQVAVRLVSLNGQPVLQALNADAKAAQAAQPQTPPQSPPASTAPRLPIPGVLGVGQIAAPGGPVSLVQAGAISAGVLSATAQGTGAGASQAGTAPGTNLFSVNGVAPGGQLTVRITGLQPPGGAVQGQLGHTGQGTTVFGPTATAATPGQTGAAAGTPLQTAGASAAQPGGGQAAGQTPQTGAVPTGSSPAGPQVQPSVTPPGADRATGLTLKPDSLFPQPAQSPPTGVQARAPLALITGTVQATGTQAQPQVQVDGGTVQLNVRANLPQGSLVTFEVLARQTATAAGTPDLRAATAATTNAAGPPLTANTMWPSVTEAFQILQRMDPVAAQQLSQVLPDGGPRSVAAALSYIQAIRSGDGRQWPGDNTLRALERTGPRGAQLARQISGEVAEMSQRSRDTGGEWRALTLPFASGGEIDKIALITRREGEGDGEKKQGGGKGEGTRFLVNLDLSKLGRMQLDGMVRSKKKAFDLVIRTEEALPQDMKMDLQALFTVSLQAAGLTGGLMFRVDQKFADPLPPAQKNAFFGPGVWA